MPPLVRHLTQIQPVLEFLSDYSLKRWIKKPSSTNIQKQHWFHFQHYHCCILNWAVYIRYALLLLLQIHLKPTGSRSSTVECWISLFTFTHLPVCVHINHVLMFWLSKWKKMCLHADNSQFTISQFRESVKLWLMTLVLLNMSSTLHVILKAAVFIFFKTF